MELTWEWKGRVGEWKGRVGLGLIVDEEREELHDILGA